ncbi:MAG TPA: LacI family transcriptional regulator [Cytophagales bacterium]|nr:LacI family transcriptional regulator [Cytophagales bacterium]HAA22301.1 LacI family transcriptional regulator [Cytophagales bacterium]HAP60487.1 LacI family transcriptional regulator [Cytophagales bacterium]
MKSGQITIKDIARELNISPSTVSRALKDHPDISAETKKAVKELAEKLDYQPNSIALSLRKSRTNTIGIVIPEIVHHFFSTVISGVEDVAHEFGYNVIIAQSNEEVEREAGNVHALWSSRVDGMLISLSRETDHFEHLENLVRRKVPLVFFDRVPETLDVCKVVVDDYEGAFHAVEHLIEQGCKNIYHLAGPAHLSISHERRKGFEDAMKKHEMPLEPHQIVETGLTLEKGRKIMRGLLQGGSPPDGIFCVSDPVAIGAMQVGLSKGLDVPNDLAVVGFSDEPITGLMQPALSSVAQPGYEMGQLSTRIFLRQMDKGVENYPPETEVLRTTLVVRESSKRK